MASESTGSSGRRGGRDLRSELLRTSRQLLDESGPSALSMREVARRAGCTHQAPYHYFANREAILAALVHEGFDELTDMLASAREGLESADLRAILTASGSAYVEFALRHPGVFRVMFRPDACDPERFPEVAQAGERARHELARLARAVMGDDAHLEAEVLIWSGVTAPGRPLGGRVQLHGGSHRLRSPRRRSCWGARGWWGLRVREST